MGAVKAMDAKAACRRCATSLPARNASGRRCGDDVCRAPFHVPPRPVAHMHIAMCLRTLRSSTPQPLVHASRHMVQAPCLAAAPSPPQNNSMPSPHPRSLSTLPPPPPPHRDGCVPGGDCGVADAQAPAGPHAGAWGACAAVWPRPRRREREGCPAQAACGAREGLQWIRVRADAWWGNV